MKKGIKGFTGGGVKEGKINTGSGQGSPVSTVKSQPTTGKNNLGNGTQSMPGEVKKGKI